MKQYEIIATTDDKFEGKKFIINPNGKSITILGKENKIIKFSNIEVEGKNIRLINPNYTIKGEEI